MVSAPFLGTAESFSSLSLHPTPLYITSFYFWHVRLLLPPGSHADCALRLSNYFFAIVWASTKMELRKFKHLLQRWTTVILRPDNFFNLHLWVRKLNCCERIYSFNRMTLFLTSFFPIVVLLSAIAAVDFSTAKDFDFPDVTGTYLDLEGFPSTSMPAHHHVIETSCLRLKTPVLCGKWSGLQQRNCEWEKIAKKHKNSCYIVLLDNLRLSWSDGITCCVLLPYLS